MNAQHSWQICFKCNSIFFAGGVTQGICTAGGAHDAHVFNRPPVSYTLEISDHAAKTRLKKSAAGTVKSESGWRRCSKCECLFHAEGGSKGMCPADGRGHEADHTTEYQLTLKSLSSHKHADVRMRKCRKCLTMFWDSNWMPGVKTPEHAGACPAKPEQDFPSGLIKTHNGSGSDVYAISRELAASESP